MIRIPNLSMEALLTGLDEKKNFLKIEFNAPLFRALCLRNATGGVSFKTL